MLNNSAIPSQPPDDHQINWLWFVAYIALYVIAILVGYSASGSFVNVVSFPAVFLTSVIVYYLYKRQLRMGNLNDTVRFADLFRSYSQSFFSGGMFAVLTELWITGVFMLIIVAIVGKSKILGSIEEEEAEGTTSLASKACESPIVHFYLLFTSFCVAGLTEEVTKAYITQYAAKLYLPHTSHLNEKHAKAIIWIGTFVGLGFGSVEGVMYVCLQGAVGGSLLGTVFAQFVNWLIRAFVAIPFHSFMGFMWGMQYARREAYKETDRTWVRMGYQQILLHGVYDFIQFELGVDLACTAVPDWSGMVISLGIAVVFVIATGVFSMWQYKNLINRGRGDLLHVEDAEYQQSK